MNTAELLEVRIDNGAAWLVLNRPSQYNALNGELIDRLSTAFDDLANSDKARVIVITGAGKAFCAGHDLREMRALGSRDAVGDLFARCSEMMQRIASLPMPVIAEVNGLATAAGCQLVAQCDLAVASDHARFAASGINLGLFCATPAVPLSRTIGKKRAAELLMTGSFIDAATALEWGLVNRVAPAASVRSETLKLVETLLAKPGAALANGKALFNRQLELGLAAAYQDATACITDNFFQAEAEEGVAAFLDKRSPNWPSRAT